MLTIIHTADWHLGQSFLGFDRDFEHARFLEWLLEELDSRQPDALLLSGDVFDSISPSASAQKRYYDFLARAHAAGRSLQIIITAGNHDAAARLEAPSVLLQEIDASVVGTVRRDENGEIDAERFLVPVTGDDGNVQAIVMAVPFLRPSDVPLVPDASDPYLDGIGELYRRVTEAAKVQQAEHFPNAAIIAMGHCHLQGGASTDSERQLVIGGAEAVHADVFDRDISYVALGHLHRAQEFDGGRIRYSGSPIPLSFSETSYRHGVLQLKFDGRTLANVDDVTVPRTTDLMRIPEGAAKPIADVLQHLESLRVDPDLPPEQHPYLEVRVQEEGPDPTRRNRIEQALQDKPVRLASIKINRSERDGDESHSSDEPPDAASLHDIHPLDVFVEAWRSEYDSEPADAVLAAFREILLQESTS